MGQVIQLAPHWNVYPSTTEALDSAECLFLISMRWWVADHREGTEPLHRLCQAMETAGAHDAAFSLDRLMSVIARTVRRPIAINCPRCPRLSEDERRLLQAASLAQAGQGDQAERMLRTALVTPVGAEFAIGPLEGLGALFAEARLMFSRRSEADGAVGAWSPSTVCEHTIH